MELVGKALGVAVVGAFFTWIASAAFKGMGPGAEVVFDALLGDPANVSDFDGFVRKGDRYDVQIRFLADQDWIQGLPYRGFTESDCETARTKIRFSLLRVAAYPLWRPEALTDVVCYRRLGENAWSANGRDYILAEAGGGWVYFGGEGREHDRALPSEGDKFQ